jgi:predicted ATPase with chaperone activity
VASRHNVEVEVDISQGLPSFQIVGLPDTAVQESRERVRAAVRNSGTTFPIPKERQYANYHIPLYAAEKWQASYIAE